MTERAIFTIASQLSVTSLPTGTGDNRYRPVTSNENGQRTSAPRLRVTPHRTCTARPRRDQILSDAPTDCTGTERGEIATSNEFHR